MSSSPIPSEEPQGTASSFLSQLSRGLLKMPRILGVLSLLIFIVNGELMQNLQADMNISPVLTIWSCHIGAVLLAPVYWGKNVKGLVLELVCSQGVRGHKAERFAVLKFACLVGLISILLCVPNVFWAFSINYQSVSSTNALYQTSAAFVFLYGMCLPAAIQISSEKAKKEGREGGRKRPTEGDGEDPASLSDSTEEGEEASTKSEIYEKASEKSSEVAAKKWNRRAILLTLLKLLAVCFSVAGAACSLLVSQREGEGISNLKGPLFALGAAAFLGLYQVSFQKFFSRTHGSLAKLGLVWMAISAVHVFVFLPCMIGAHIAGLPVLKLPSSPLGYLGLLLVASLASLVNLLQSIVCIQASPLVLSMISALLLPLSRISDLILHGCGSVWKAPEEAVGDVLVLAGFVLLVSIPYISK